MANIKRANTSGITKTGVAISDVPDAPTIGAVADLSTGSTASVAYTAATTGGAATTFTATSSPGGLTGTGSSPITVSGLSTGTAYTFTVTASNTTGSATSGASSSLTLASVGVFESIATATGTGSSQVISFTSIPSTFKHLQIRAIVRSTEAGSGTNYYTTLNGDSGSNYAAHRLQGDGTTATAAGTATQTGIFTGRAPGAGTTTGTMAALIVDIHDYASTTKYKTVRQLSGQDSNNTYAGLISLRSGLWMSTSAVTSVTFTIDNPNFSTSTTFALYGIKGA